MRYLVLISFLFFTGCVKQQLANNPEILFDVIKENPMKFFETLQVAQKAAMKKAQEKQMESQLSQKKVNPVIEDSRVIVGAKNAPITIVEYSDFECPYCSRGFATVKQLLSEYKGQIRFVFKHLPLDFHPLAKPAALYYEAIALQSHEKAIKFHDKIFENQNALKTKKMKFLNNLVVQLGLNLSKVKKDMKKSSVKKIVQSDMDEAKKFGISGTPGYVVNGVVIKGAYPIDVFRKIIEKLKK